MTIKRFADVVLKYHNRSIATVHAGTGHEGDFKPTRSRLRSMESFLRQMAVRPSARGRQWGGTQSTDFSNALRRASKRPDPALWNRDICKSETCGRSVTLELRTIFSVFNPLHMKRLGERDNGDKWATSLYWVLRNFFHLVEHSHIIHLVEHSHIIHLVEHLPG